MTVHEKNTQGEPGRAAMKAIRAARASRAPTPPKLQGLLDNVSGDDDNKLPKARQGFPNEVIIENVLDITPVPPPNRDVKLQLLWNGMEVGDAIIAKTPVTTQQKLELPGLETSAEGRFALSYRLTYVRDVYDFPVPEFILIDKEPPNKNIAGEPIELPTPYEDGRITIERLATDPDLELTIPLHPDRRTGDTARVYMGESYPGTIVDTYIAPDAGSDAMTVTLTKARIEAGGEGKRIIYYQWQDRVGNEGPPSHELDVLVLLTQQPTNLKPLEVPEAPGPDNLITIKDAYPDVGVIIRAYDNVGAMDEVALTWDGIPQPRKRSVDGFPMIFDVPYDHVKSKGLGDRPVSVTYSIWRSTQEYPENTVVPVNVDLRRPGTLPPDPEDPETGNPNLSVVTVQAAVTGDPNKFELVDAGQDGKASTVIDKVREVGDVYQLYWGDVAVPAPGGVYTVTGSENDDDPVPFTIPHAFITAQGNGQAIPVHYKITNPALPDNNPNPSLRQPVSVYVVPVTLPEPKINFTFMIGSSEYLDCGSLRNIAGQGHVAVVTVPGGAPLELGMDLAFTWTGVGWDGTDPVPITPYEFTKKLANEEHRDGFTVYIPYNAVLQPIIDGSGSIEYSALVQGRSETSDKHEVQVIARTGDGGMCPIPTVR